MISIIIHLESESKSNSKAGSKQEGIDWFAQGGCEMSISTKRQEGAGLRGVVLKNVQCLTSLLEIEHREV